MGLCADEIREPLCPMSEGGLARLSAEMKTIGLI